MEPRIPIDREQIAAFCEKWKIVEFSLFGSVLREDFRPDSDVDVLVKFAEDAKRGLRRKADMEAELAELFERPVNVVDREDMERNPNYIHRRSVLENDRRYTKDESRLLYILLNARAVLEDIEGLSYNEYLSHKYRAGLLSVPLCRLGFCASRVSADYKAQHPEIPWDELITAEERLQLLSLDDQDVAGTWELATKTVPRVIKLITPLIPPEDDPRPKPIVEFTSPLTIYEVPRCARQTCC